MNISMTWSFPKMFNAQFNRQRTFLREIQYIHFWQTVLLTSPITYLDYESDSQNYEELLNTFRYSWYIFFIYVISGKIIENTHPPWRKKLFSVLSIQSEVWNEE
jgi:hypothetical protein